MLTTRQCLRSCAWGVHPRVPRFAQAGRRSKRRGKEKEHWIGWNLVEDKREEIEGKIGAVKTGKELKGREHREISPGFVLSIIHGFIPSFPKGFAMPMSFVSDLILPESPSITSFISFSRLPLYLLFFAPFPMSSKFKAKVICFQINELFFP